MASSQQTLDELEVCPECGESAMSSDRECARCQPPNADADTDSEDEYGEGQCQNCGSHVSETFRRVCGDNDNLAHACPDCHANNGVFPHAVAGNDTDGIQVVQR